MSCSKPSKMHMDTPQDPYLRHFNDLTTFLGEPYYRTTQVFSIGSDNANIDSRYFAMHIWETKNKKGVMAVCAASVWEIHEGGNPHFLEFPWTDVVRYGNGMYFHDLTGSQNAKDLLLMPKTHLVHGFTTNDPATFDSFSRGVEHKRCVEHAVMCVAKSKLHMAWVLKTPSEDLLKLALTSRFVQPHTLNAIVDGLGNDKRFDKNLPAGYDKFSDEEKATYKATALQAARERVLAVGAENFKKKYLAWIELNFSLDPIATSPEVFKVEVGRALLMSPEELVEWNRKAGLLFLLATSKYLSEEPVNLHIALCCKDATILEITPDDARYGVIPPNKESLDFVKTPLGKAWFVGLSETHGEPQYKFLAEFDGHGQAALLMLTTKMDEYRYGILGLTKRICLDFFTKPNFLADDLLQEVSGSLAEAGLTPQWKLHGVDVFENPSTVDSFALLGHVGRSVCGKPDA